VPTLAVNLQSFDILTASVHAVMCVDIDESRDEAYSV
jgi:hypothetical protein